MASPISTIIVNYNAGPGLVACIQSVINQVSEVVLVDNASRDNSIALVEAQFAGDARVRIIRNTDNLGFAAACNIGARAAQHLYWFFLNPDCICGNNSVAELFEVLTHNAKAGMVGGLLLNPDGSEQAGGRRLTPTPSRTLVRAFGLQALAKRWPSLLVDFNLHQQPRPDKPIAVEAISGACMLVKPEAIAQVGLWDDGYFLHCEDLDWCMRFIRAGWDILFVPSAPITHDQGTCSKSRPLFVEWHKHKGMSRFYLKFFHTAPALPLLALVLIAIWGRFALVALRSLIRKPR
ncbi:glycosyltransferase family 2 protein [Cellvibrio sp. UBA7661]|uniref:glycosyltransferase family 2 protein n=1 Tax=Cellvibrio sp. UBA7661 TaxID=1946311 RepID=UPI002F35B45D